MSDQFTRYNKRTSLAGRVAKLQSEVKELWADCERLRRERDEANLRHDLAIVRAEEAEEREDEAIKRAEKAEREIDRLSEIVTECDGVECVKHDGLVRIAIKERKEADERAARYGKALEQLEWSGYRTHDLRQCPICFSLKRDRVHKENCFIAQALYPDWYPAAQESSQQQKEVKQ